MERWCDGAKTSCEDRSPRIKRALNSSSHELFIFFSFSFNKIVLRTLRIEQIAYLHVTADPKPFFAGRASKGSILPRGFSPTYPSGALPAQVACVLQDRYPKPVTTTKCCKNAKRRLLLFQGSSERGHANRLVLEGCQRHSLCALHFASYASRISLPIRIATRGAGQWAPFRV